jgi:hypothetical protein
LLAEGDVGQSNPKLGAGLTLLKLHSRLREITVTIADNKYLSIDKNRGQAMGLSRIISPALLKFIELT